MWTSLVHGVNEYVIASSTRCHETARA